MKTNNIIQKSLCLGIILLFLSSFTIFKSVENNTIEGTIFDEKNQPLANVEILNTTNFFATVSDANGHFKIEGKRNDVLKFVYPSKPIKTITASEVCDLKIYFEKQPEPVPINHYDSTPISTSISDHKRNDNPYKNAVIGQVTDRFDVLPGAYISIKGTKTVATSDLNGFYGIDAKKGDILVIQYIGMDQVAVKVTDSVMNIKMKESSVTLDEVVVVGYGIRDSDDDSEYKSESVRSTSTALAIKEKVADLSIAPSSEMSDKSVTAVSNKDIKAGQLTAGEVNDFSKWEYWQDLTKEQLNEWQKYWKMSPTNRYSVVLRNEQGYPIINKIIHLVDENNEQLWTSRTDNTGRAELWCHPFVLDSQLNTTNLRIIDNNENLISDKPKEFRKGINTYTYAEKCNDLNKINIAFMVDATGSMGDEISYLQAEINDVIERAKKSLPEVDLSMGSVFYRDFGDEYLVKNFDFTQKIPDIVSFIKKQSANGGGDTPEAVIEGYEACIDKMKWDDDARTKLLFVILDAPPHYSETNVLKLQKLAQKASEKGIRIIPIAASGIDKSTEYLMRAMALETNGTYLFITNHSGIGNNHIEPSTDSYKVEMLNDLLLRVILQFTAVNHCEQTETNYPTNAQIEEKLVKEDVVNWSYYPNPTSGLVTVTIDKEANELYLFDTTGKLITYQNDKTKQYQLDLSGLPNAIYYLKIITNDKSLYGKIIKKL